VPPSRAILPSIDEGLPPWSHPRKNRSMSCRSNEIGRLQKLERPARLFSVLVGLGLVTASFWVPDKKHSGEVAIGGVLVLFVAVVMPVLTEFEIDFFGFHAKASVGSRKSSLRTICLGEARTVASLVALVGVDPVQVAALAEEAVEDACRLWRGRIVEELVREFVLCRAVHLVRVSLRLGGPYRVLALTSTAGYGPRLTAFAAFSPTERLTVALVEYAEISEDEVATMMDLDRSVVTATLSQGLAAIEQAVKPS
jgi:hypothetical protein